jgi:hypothetical protein
MDDFGGGLDEIVENVDVLVFPDVLGIEIDLVRISMDANPSIKQKVRPSLLRIVNVKLPLL